MISDTLQTAATHKSGSFSSSKSPRARGVSINGQLVSVNGATPVLQPMSWETKPTRTENSTASLDKPQVSDGTGTVGISYLRPRTYPSILASSMDSLGRKRKLSSFRPTNQSLATVATYRNDPSWTLAQSARSYGRHLKIASRCGSSYRVGRL